jgi:hypothetical protein
MPATLGIAALILELAFPSQRKTVQLALLIVAVLWAIFRVPIYMEMTRGMIIGSITATALCAIALAFLWQFLPMQIILLAFIAVVIVFAFAFVAAKVAELLGGAVEKPSLKL